MEVVRALHLIAMAFFVGGQLMLAAVVVPVARRGDRDALRAMARRFGYGTLAALAILLVSGSVLASEYDRWDELGVKLALVGVAIVLVIAHMLRPAAHALMGLVFLVSLAIVYAGVTIAH